MSYEEIEHTTDWAFRVTAPTLPELFTNAALAIFALEGAIDAQSTLTRVVQVEGIDHEALLANWLNELLFLQKTQRETYQKFDLEQFSDTALQATIYGAPSQPTTKFIQAVTLHNPAILETETGWETTIVVDVEMKILNTPIESAVGGVLIHNIADAQGHKTLNKGHRLVASDLAKLGALGKTRVIIGMFEDGDVSENDAATRVADALGDTNLATSAIGTGRVNVFSNVRGVFKVNDNALDQINMLEGITLATIPSNTVVEPKKMVATIKTIGLAVPEKTLVEVECIAREDGNVIGVLELVPARVAVILTSSPEARERVQKGLVPPIHARVQELGSTVISTEFVDHVEGAIADAIARAKNAQANCVILAGETSIMDATDVTPGGIIQAGGSIEIYGAPVEPGNLLLLAYAETMPIIGAPGCVKSRDINVVDLILPRLLAGERVGKRDIVALANGGLLI